MSVVKDPSFDYLFFDRSFLIRKDLWHPDRPRETVEAYNIANWLLRRSSSWIPEVKH